MKVMVFSTPVGFIVGEIGRETDDQFILRNPGIIQMRPPTAPAQPMTLIIAKLVPNFMDNKDALTIAFPLEKSKILFSGPVDSGLHESYQKYSAAMLKERSNLKVVSGNALSKLKPFGWPKKS